MSLTWVPVFAWRGLCCQGYFKNQPPKQHAHRVYIDERSNALLHGCVGGNIYPSGKNTHAYAYSHTVVLAHTSCYIHTAAERPSTLPMWACDDKSLCGTFHVLISTYSVLWNEKVNRYAGLSAWIHLPTRVCVIVHTWRAAIILLTGRTGAVSPRCPLFSRGVGEVLDGSPCIEILHQSVHSLPGPTEKDRLEETKLFITD